MVGIQPRVARRWRRRWPPNALPRALRGGFARNSVRDCRRARPPAGPTASDAPPGRNCLGNEQLLDPAHVIDLAAPARRCGAGRCARGSGSFAMRSTSMYVVDPVGGGFVDSLVRPGGNATGFTIFEYS